MCSGTDSSFAFGSSVFEVLCFVFYKKCFKNSGVRLMGDGQLKNVV